MKMYKLVIGTIVIGSLLGFNTYDIYSKNKELKRQEELNDYYEFAYRENFGGAPADGFSGPNYNIETIQNNLVCSINGNNTRRFIATNSNAEKDNEKESKYIQIAPINLDGYENWTPNGDQSNYSVDRIASDTKQITGIESNKVIKNESGKLDYPESTVVSIIVEFESEQGNNKSYAGGTGVMIGRNKILTCAHLFYLEDEIELNNGKKYSYLHNGNISGIEIQADMEQLENGIMVGDPIFEYADKLYVSSDYIKSVELMEEDVKSEKYVLSSGDEDNLRKLFENDFAIIEIDEKENKEEGEKELWEETGWIGILPFEVTGNQKWGTIYGFPEIAPNLPSLEKLIECLKIDAKGKRWNSYWDDTRGISIRLNDAIDAIHNKKGSKEHYKGLLDKNGIEMYSSYYRLEYTSEFPKLLQYIISTYSGDSGAPIVQSVYNSRLGKYFPYTSGIHCGYVAESDKLDENGDLYMYVYDYLNRTIDFKKPYESDTPEIDAWSVGLQVCGYNYGRQIDKQLYNYLLANGFYLGYSYTPKDREG